MPNFQSMVPKRSTVVHPVNNGVTLSVYVMSKHLIFQLIISRRVMEAGGFAVGDTVGVERALEGTRSHYRVRKAEPNSQDARKITSLGRNVHCGRVSFSIPFGEVVRKYTDQNPSIEVGQVTCSFPSN